LLTIVWVFTWVLCCLSIFTVHVFWLSFPYRLQAFL
jgi:hypothetical protein